MKKLAMLLILSATVTSYAKSPSRKIYCQDSKYNNVITADVTKGSLAVNEANGTEELKLTGLSVKVKHVGNRDIITFKNNGAISDLPKTVFRANVNSSGTGTATSYDDLSGGTTDYKCGFYILLK